MFGSALFLRSGVAALDQALLSGLSFVVSIVLVKHVTAEEFGYYSVAIAVSLFLVSVQNALVNTPLVVLLPAKRGDDRRRYLGALYYGQWIVLVPAACLAALLAGLLRLAGLDAAKASVAAAVSVASVGQLIREFLRAHSFAEEAPWRVIAMDSCYTALAVSLGGVTLSIFKVSAASILILMGFSSLLAARVFRAREPWPYEKDSVKGSFRENWPLGKWALLGVLVTHVQSYSYLYLLGALLGSVAVAQVSASRLLLMPLLLAQAGWANIAVPHGAKLREQNLLLRFFKEQLWANLVFTAGTASYVAAVQASYNLLQPLVLSEKYAQSGDYLFFWGAVFVVTFFSKNASCGLQVLKDFKIISNVNVLTMIVTVGSGYLLIRAHEVKGALVALIIGETLLAVALWFYYTRTIAKSRLHEPAGQGM